MNTDQRILNLLKLAPLNGAAIAKCLTLRYETITRRLKMLHAEGSISRRACEPIRYRNGRPPYLYEIKA